VRRGLIAAEPAIAPLVGMDRLNGPDRPPVCVALSGGGDSLALLRLAKAWAVDARRQLIALTVDHGLQPASAEWTRSAAQVGQRLGVAHRSLIWRGEKPTAGLPAAARAARHALLADAARSAGARVVLMAHTADDVLEAELMRRAGSSTPSPRLWSPSPAWPQGRGVFLLRPLLSHRRVDLRDWLAGLGEQWIEDPANDDPRYARTLARRRLQGRRAAAVSNERNPPTGWRLIREGLGGELTAPRDIFRADPEDSRTIVGAMALCAAGTSRPAPGAALDRVAAKLREALDFTATLAGARIEARSAEVLFCREVGERARGGLQELALSDGEHVFDGRFTITARDAGSHVVPLRGLAARLAPAERHRLKQIAAAARGALPALLSPGGDVSCPVLTPNPAVSAVPLGLARLRAALGVIRDEKSAAGA
jgi:tRNA(Ile)-lysidine synthase